MPRTWPKSCPRRRAICRGFLTESPWDDLEVIARLQELLAPCLVHPEAVWVVDESGFIKQRK